MIGGSGSSCGSDVDVTGTVDSPIPPSFVSSFPCTLCFCLCFCFCSSEEVIGGDKDDDDTEHIDIDTDDDDDDGDDDDDDCGVFDDDIYRVVFGFSFSSFYLDSIQFNSYRFRLLVYNSFRRLTRV